MGYSFQQDSTISENVQRVITEQIERAKSELIDADDIHESIHSARKRFKKIRGTLRLVRPALGTVYQQENTRFRDAGRMLANVRDAEAMIETIDKLRRENQDNPDIKCFHSLRAALVEQLQQLVSDDSSLEQRIETVLESLNAAEHDMNNWPELPEEFETVGGGLKKTYKRGRDALQRSYEEPGTETFHNWRKRVKYSLYHVRLLESIWPSMMKTYRRELKYLSDVLGDDHDLAVLQETVEGQPELMPDEQARHELAELTMRRQEHLRALALTIGQRLYAPRPRAVIQSVEQYWNMWHLEAERER
jgi:CHAD domain-containing protein